MYVPCPSYTCFRVLTIIKNDNIIKNDTYNYGQSPGHFAEALLAIRKKRKPAAVMASYGDRLLNCVECGLEGKCMLDEFLNGAEPLTDCDFAGGPGLFVRHRTRRPGETTPPGADSNATS